ncbi:uncharacterized protein [Panulirus ornatus]|uniref:uncharacterized protein isoform X2 n=1 Tax=Panulirus ornatus TaxID=150431 RepID=UPI003A8BF5CF
MFGKPEKMATRKMARVITIFTCVFFMVMWPPLVSPRTISDEISSSEDKVDDSNCSVPVHCCRHLPQSSEFIACCNASGCCSPCDNLYVYEGHGVYETREDCEGAYECCVSPFLSDEFNKCCFEHQCCPFCGSVPEGCSYGEKVYPWGTVVETSPENCTKFVCGAKVSNSTPYITEVIFTLYHPLPPPAHHSQECGKVDHDYCVNSRGIIHEQNSEWLESLCSWCRCEDGHIRCEEVEPVCPPAPHPDCTEVPADCCSTWICHNLTTQTIPYGRSAYSLQLRTCQDDEDIHREVGETWTDWQDPCIIFLCTKSGIKKQPGRLCPSVGPLPHVGCRAVVEDCCHKWDCTECVDEEGVHHAVGETWVDPRDPCIRYLCTQDGIEEQPGRYCPPVGPRPHVGCKKIEEDCCQTWHCASCVDEQGFYRKVGEEWYDPLNPCIHNHCTRDDIIERSRRVCPGLLPRPHPPCELIVDNCCQRWQCPGCIDDVGSHHNVGEEWTDPTHPCTHYRCLQVGIEKTEVFCPPLDPRPHRSCQLVTENCCHTWSCTRCVDEQGKEREAGEEWLDPTDACKDHMCTDEGIQTTEIACRPALPPGPDCYLQKKPGKCCPVWNCPEECPDPSSLSRDCVGLHHDQCQRDEECPAGDQCCLVAGCGKQCITVDRPCKSTLVCQLLSGQCVDRCGRDEHPVHGVCLTNNCFCCVPETDPCMSDTQACLTIDGRCDDSCRSDEKSVRHLCNTDDCLCCVQRSRQCSNTRECNQLGGQCGDSCSRGEAPLQGVCATSTCLCCVPHLDHCKFQTIACRNADGRCDSTCRKDEDSVQHLCRTGDCVCCTPRRRPCLKSRPCLQLGGQCGSECNRGEVSVERVCSNHDCVCCVPEFNRCKFQSDECRNIEGRCDVSCRKDEDPVHHLCGTDNCVCCTTKGRSCRSSSLCYLVGGQCVEDCIKGEHPIQGVCTDYNCVCCVAEFSVCRKTRMCRQLGGQCSEDCGRDEITINGVCDDCKCVCCLPISGDSSYLLD